MATSIHIKNTSQTNTLRVKAENYDKKKGKWTPVQADNFVAPNTETDIWIDTNNRRIVIEDLPG